MVIGKAAWKCEDVTGRGVASAVSSARGAALYVSAVLCRTFTARVHVSVKLSLLCVCVCVSE